MKKKSPLKIRPVGRPPLPKNERRTKQITVRLTTKEMKNLESIARDKLVANIAHQMIVESTKRQLKKSKKAS